MVSRGDFLDELWWEMWMKFGKYVFKLGASFMTYIWKQFAIGLIGGILHIVSIPLLCLMLALK